MAATALSVIQMILAAEPAIVSAVHNILSGTGTADDLAILKADSIAWQAIANKAQAEIDRIKTPVVQEPTVPPNA